MSPTSCLCSTPHRLGDYSSWGSSVKADGRRPGDIMRCARFNCSEYIRCVPHLAELTERGDLGQYSSRSPGAWLHDCRPVSTTWRAGIAPSRRQAQLEESVGRTSREPIALAGTALREAEPGGACQVALPLNAIQRRVFRHPPHVRLQQNRFLIYSCPAGLVPGSIMHASGLERMCQHGLWFRSRMKEAEE